MESSVKLLKNLPIKLNFEKYISNICKKASNQLNAICRLQTFMGHKEKETMINILSCIQISVNIWQSPKLQNKVEKIHERSLKFLLTSLDC